MKWLGQSLASIIAPMNGVGPRSYDSLPPFATDDDYDRVERGGVGRNNNYQYQQQPPPQISMVPTSASAAAETFVVDEEERILAQFTQNLTSEERMRLIYFDIKKNCPQVRLSNLHVYDMISTVETIRGAGPGGQDEYREVMWMTATHLYMGIILHNRRPGGAFPGCKVHIGNLASMAMRGVYKTHVNACADLVWRTLYAQGYELYSEEGLLIKEAPPEPCQQQRGKEENEKKTEEKDDEEKTDEKKRSGGSMTPLFEILHDPDAPLRRPTRVFEDDFTPPDVDARELDGASSRVRHTGKNQRVAESSKDK